MTLEEFKQTTIPQEEAFNYLSKVYSGRNIGVMYGVSLSKRSFTIYVSHTDGEEETYILTQEEDNTLSITVDTDMMLYSPYLEYTQTNPLFNQLLYFMQALKTFAREEEDPLNDIGISFEEEGNYQAFTPAFALSMMKELYPVDNYTFSSDSDDDIVHLFFGADWFTLRKHENNRYTLDGSYTKINNPFYENLFLCGKVITALQQAQTQEKE